MPIIFFLIIWYFVAGRNNPKTFGKLMKNKGKIFFILAILFMTNFSSTLIKISIALATMGIPFYVLYRIFASIMTPEQTKQKKKAQKLRNETIPKSEQLPNAVPKRIKIVDKFNKKYCLNLTNSQIQTIVDASYISTDWEYLILSMNREYQTIHQWFKAPFGDWLRVYLKVFNVQTVSSDMAQQKRICIDSFDQIFRSIDLSTYNTPAWDISKINNTYMTNFDDISFMIAYRFLEANGRKYNLGNVEILKADEELSDLKRKYDEASAPMH